MKLLLGGPAGSTEVSARSSISRILFPLAAAVTKSSNHHALGGIEGRKVNGGKVGRHWSDPLWDSGEWLRGRVSNEPLALNDRSIARETGERTLCDGLPCLGA